MLIILLSFKIIICGNLNVFHVFYIIMHFTIQNNIFDLF